MAHDSYWVKRYSKKTRIQVLLMVIGMAAVFIGCLVALQKSETDAERTARIQSEFTGQPIHRHSVMKEQDEYLQFACLDGKDACDKAKEEIRKENCQLFGESCTRKPNQK
jgi:hypothetical protein